MSRGPIPDLPRDRPTTDEVKPLIEKIYASKDGGAGCCLHIALDDGNLDRDSLFHCFDWACEKGHALCAYVAYCMLQMTGTQKRKLYHGG